MTNTNVGGYSGCALYATINNAIYNSLPDDLRAVMKNVSKLTSAGNQSATIVTTQEKLFLLSEVEIFGSITHAKSGEGTQYAFFTNGGARVKTIAGVASGWWERSPIGSGATYFCYVNSSGAASNAGASSSYGEAQGICVNDVFYHLPYLPALPGAEDVIVEEFSGAAALAAIQEALNA